MLRVSAIYHKSITIVKINQPKCIQIYNTVKLYHSSSKGCLNVNRLKFRTCCATP